MSLEQIPSPSTGNPGSCVYRNVYIRQSEPLYLRRDGLFVRSVCEEKRAEVLIDISIVNALKDKRCFYLTNRISADGSSSLAESGIHKELLAGEESPVELKLLLP